MPTPPPTRRGLGAGNTVDRGRYKLVRKLGAGGNGVVWLAIHVAMDAEVVIKFPNSQVLRDEAGRKQFEHETRSLISFSNRHPNIVNILDSGEHQGHPYVVMQYLTRGSLQDYMFGRRAYTSPENKRLHQSSAWLTAIANSLDFLHEHGLLHRDVKPGNILLDDSFSAYLADFGIATLAASGMQVIEQLLGALGESTQIVGSLPYIAPEVLLGRQPTPSADQYSLAVTVYEYMSGQHPYKASSAKGLADLQEKNCPVSILKVRSELSADCWATLSKALDKDPRERFASCGDFAVELARKWPSAAIGEKTTRPPTSRPLPSEETKRASAATSATEGPEGSDTAAFTERKKIKLSRLMRDKKR